jgi:hypothetical protein
MPFTKDAIENATAELNREWHGVDIAYEAFLAAARKARRASFCPCGQNKGADAVLDHVRTASSIAVDQARRDLDAIVGSIAAEQVKLRTFPIASDQAWKTMKRRLDETRTSYERTWTNILAA